MMETRFVDSYSYRTKLTVPDHDFVIYGHPANFNYFVTTPLVAASDAGTSLGIAQRKAHSRRRYVGDTNPIGVDSHRMDFLIDPGRKTGSAIPGWSFILDDGTEKRQFTTTADVLALHLWLADNVKATTRLYTEGAMYTIDPGEQTEP